MTCGGGVSDVCPGGLKNDIGPVAVDAGCSVDTGGGGGGGVVDVSGGIGFSMIGDGVVEVSGGGGALLGVIGPMVSGSASSSVPVSACTLINAAIPASTGLTPGLRPIL